MFNHRTPLLFKKPTLGWRDKRKLLKEFRQGGIADRWSERRLLILLAEYRLNCRREFMLEIESQLRVDPSSDYCSITKQGLMQVAH